MFLRLLIRFQSDRCGMRQVGSIQRRNDSDHGPEKGALGDPRFSSKKQEIKDTGARGLPSSSFARERLRQSFSRSKKIITHNKMQKINPGSIYLIEEIREIT